MKKNKKIMMAASFCIGAILLATTAFADIASKSGYDQLKEVIKSTAGKLSENIHSYTTDQTVTLKDNGKLLYSTNATLEYDKTSDVSKSVSSKVYENGDKSNYLMYFDKSTVINYNSEENTYYVTDFPDKDNDYSYNRNFLWDNPFDSPREKDYERVFDAVIGDLKEYVVVEVKGGGSKDFSGSLSEGQIPALINAGTSLLFKQSFSGGAMGRDTKLPQLVDDIFIKKITGKAAVNKEGVLENIFVTGIMSGKDKEGINHEITIEAIITISKINSTTIIKPDLSGKKIQKETAHNMNIPASLPQMFVGKYKNDIIITKDETFVQIGERFLEITKIEGNTLSGRYYEEYKKGYSDYQDGIREFSFKASANVNDGNNYQFQYTDSSGNAQKGDIYFASMSGKAYFNINFSQPMTDHSFNRVFDE